MSTFFTRRGLRIALLTSATAFVGLPASATAAGSVSSIQSAPGDLVVDKTSMLLVSGFADPRDGAWQWVTVDLNPTNLPCAPTWGANDERRVYRGFNETVEGQFSGVAVGVEPTSPGDFTACAYLWEMWSKETVGVGSAPVTVRRPTASLEIVLPAKRLPANATISYTATTTAEIERELNVEVNAYGVDCGPNVYANDDVTKWNEWTKIAGGPVTNAYEAKTPTRGHYRLCGYIGRSAAESTPDLILRGPDFWAGPEPTCSLGPAPRRPSGRVIVTCSGSDGPVELTARRGGRTFRTTVNLTGGRGSVAGRAIGLKRRSRVTVALSIDGVSAGRRTLRVR